MQQRKIKVIISGGGTGGHIFPAIAIANGLKAMNSENEILFVGASGRMEMEKVPAAGYKIEGLNISGLQRKLTFKNLSFPFKLIASVRKAKRIVQDFNPDVAVGVGGYASGPLLYAATGMKVPALIQEQNSFPGITNKFLAKRVNKICVAYEGLEKYFPKEKLILTGNPVRQDILQLDGKREEGYIHFGLLPGKRTVLVIGGSLGARTINESMKASLSFFSMSDVQLIWQTGKLFFEEAKSAVKESGVQNIKVFDFIGRMDYAYATADVVVSRAGASSVSELCLVKKPAILIPSPNVAEDHQTKNAIALVNKQAALMVRDVEARTKLIEVLDRLMKNEAQQKSLTENIGKLAIKNSAEMIANEVYNLIG